MRPGDLPALRHAVRTVHVADSVLAYAVAVVGATRSYPGVAIGASTRAAIALVRCAQARTILQGRPHVLPDDIKALAVPVLSHRIAMTGDDGGHARGQHVITDIIARVPAPLSGA
jgi:MoxR-like ATPase